MDASLNQLSADKLATINGCMYIHVATCVMGHCITCSVAHYATDIIR